MIRQAHLIAVVSTFLIGCAVLLVIGGSGVRAQTSDEKKQGHSEATRSKTTLAEQHLKKTGARGRAEN